MARIQDIGRTLRNPTIWSKLIWHTTLHIVLCHIVQRGVRVVVHRIEGDDTTLSGILRVLLTINIGMRRLKNFCRRARSSLCD